MWTPYWQIPSWIHWFDAGILIIYGFPGREFCDNFTKSMCCLFWRWKFQNYLSRIFFTIRLPTHTILHFNLFPPVHRRQCCHKIGLHSYCLLIRCTTCYPPMSKCTFTHLLLAPNSVHPIHNGAPTCHCHLHCLNAKTKWKRSWRLNKKIK